MILKVKPFNVRDWEPHYRHVNDSGFDLVATHDVCLLAGRTATVKTGLFVELTPGTELQVRPRSSMSKKEILCHFGTVDEGYRGEVLVLLTNLSDGDQFIYKGDRVAQAVIAPVYRPEIVFAEELSESDRGENGFGSTGR